MKSICILGAGRGGITLAELLKKEEGSLDITVIDKKSYFFDKNYFFPLLFNKEKEKVINLNEFFSNVGINFINKEVERVSFSKKNLYFKDKSTMGFKNLIVCTGLISQELSIKGEHREGFFYLSEIDPLSFRNYIKIASDFVIFASTILGVRLAFCLSFFNKEIKLISNSLDFLGRKKEEVISILKRRNIDIYENAEITEVIGNSIVKATKISLPKVFSSNVVVVDTHLLPNLKILETSFKEGELPPQVMLLGDVARKNIEKEYFFIFNSINVYREAKALAEKITERGKGYFSPKVYTLQDIESFLDEEFNEKKVLSWIS
ncbi:MAG: FAD-dependent oxidoreductase [Candidatus Omnitrophica bacterium]|nr:FAD-dependent oxidoreductase [Candidatus Omnitrophota bacterium]